MWGFDAMMDSPYLVLVAWISHNETQKRGDLDAIVKFLVAALGDVCDARYFLCNVCYLVVWKSYKCGSKVQALELQAVFFKSR